MGYSRSEVVAQAQSWIGLNEADGSHKQIIDKYNAHTPLARGYKVQYTDAWCATFVSAVAIVLGYTSIIPTECSCDKMIELFKNLGEWVEDDSYTPSAGDVIFYDWQDSGSGDNTGASDHVGYVEKVSGTTITVIEGNKSDAVGRRTIQVNGKYIRGYGVPKYTGSSTTSTSSSSSSSSMSSSSTKTKEATEKASKGPDSSLTGTYKAIEALNIRNGAGTAKTLLVKVPKGTKVQCYGYYSIASKGTKWLYIQVTYNGVQYTGFASSTKLSKVS